MGQNNQYMILHTSIMSIHHKLQPKLFQFVVNFAIWSGNFSNSVNSTMDYLQLDRKLPDVIPTS